uniref:Dpy-19-like 1, like (H. sapiens) n=1 Tax=Sphaeramia orbicularis TaxID=375764 RepID=A0A672Z0D4_9TELE
EIMVAKNRKQSGKSPATQTDRDKSPFVSPSGKSNVRRPGRDGKAFNSSLPNGLSGIRHKLGLTPSGAVTLGITLLLGKLGPSFPLCYFLLVHVFTLLLSRCHLSQLFENDRHFSHLSNLEKEMAFRTEMGLYYSYYKTIIEAPSFLDGLHMVMNDQLTEYPLVINTLKRFNLYPEMCWSINRGEGYSCMGDPAYFYVTCVFLLNGVMLSLFFVYGAYLSGSLLGGIVTALCFFFNHGESTRVMWTPPLRESFAYPFLVLQMLLLTYILRYANHHLYTGISMVALGMSNLCFMLPWQFAQFVLLTQVASLFASYILGYLGATKMQFILATHMITLGVCFVLMFGNSMLLTSFYASSLVSIWVSMFTMMHYHSLHSLYSLNYFAATTVRLIISILFCFSKAHISGLIKSKFTSYKDFHTMMYTCAAEFDFMEFEVKKKKKSLSIPPYISVVFLILPKLVSLQLVYHSLQLVAFAVLAILIMRLKLFLTPHMCIMASLICSKQLFSWFGEKLKHQIAVFAVLAVMAIQGVANLQGQWAIIGEFSNLPQEELLDWIQYNTQPDSVFAGAMPTMASVKLSAGRAIVNHPHYEDAGLRSRTKLVYSMYSRMSGETVKRNLMKLGVDYFILEDSWCTRRTRPGCSMPEIWDIEDPQNVGKIPLCTHMSRNSRPHFNTVFSNDVYKVLKIPKVAKDLR